MKTLYPILVILLSLFLTSSCALWSGGKRRLPVNSFLEISDITKLNGTYQNKTNKEFEIDTAEKSKGKLSNIFHLSSDTIDSVNLKFSDKNVILTIKDKSGLQEKSYKGKFKKNYFEITLKKKIIPIPFIYFIRDIEKVRIGRDEEDNLLIHYWSDWLGWALIVAGGKHEFEYVFRKVE